MELRVECVDGSVLPPGCYVGVRVGDVLKQGRYDAQRCYNFPSADRRRNAKIDIYRHVGSTVVAVDPDAKSLHEVSVSSTDPSCAALKLKVNVQSNAADAGKARETRQKAVKNQAKDYLSKHSIEEKLSEAVKALLREQPANPTEYICKHLMGDGTLTSSGGATTKDLAQSTIGAPTGKPNGQAAENLSSNDTTLKQAPAATAAAVAPKPAEELDDVRLKARDVLVQACQDGGLQEMLKHIEPQAQQPSRSGFELQPSVGTWLQNKSPGPKKVKVWNKLPSVGTWLARPPDIEAEGPSRSFMMPTQMLVGPQFYSLGLSSLPRIL